MRSLLLIITLSLFFFNGFTQEALITDTSTVSVREFNKAKINALKAEPDFQYDRALEPPVSLWDRFWSWFWHRVGEIFNTRSGRRTITSILVILAVAVLVYTVMKFTGMTSVGLFGSRNTGEGIPYNTFQENIHSISFQEAIDRAISEGNLRLAIRLLYLQTLKNLSDRELITWKINKTNVAYVQELRGTNYQQPFNILTSKFETNWYGDRQIDQAAFRLVQKEFDKFNEQIS